jgi:putative ABC transport system substrate-binding protein
MGGTRKIACTEILGLRRRDLIAMLGGAILNAPSPAPAQSAGRTAHLGVLYPAPRAAWPNGPLFFAEFAERGYVEGRNIVVDYRPAPDQASQVAAAAVLVGEPVDLILTPNPECLQAAIGATRTIPIVFGAISFDPVARGWVASLAHPGGNATGVVLRSVDLVPKQLQLLREVVPAASRLAVLWDEQTSDQINAVVQSAKALGLRMRALKLQKPPYDFNAAFQRLAEETPQILLVLSSAQVVLQGDRVAALALCYRMPAMFAFSPSAHAGGLMAYGSNLAAMWRRAADLAARILNGAKPADLPIERADRFELVINLKTANALGITAPPSLLARADEIIE